MNLNTTLEDRKVGTKLRIEEFLSAGKSFFASSSFQTHSLPMLHVLGQLAPQMPVYFIQTGFHFPETLRFRDEVAEAFNLKVINIESQVPKIQQRNSQGNFYFTSDPDYCCFLNKTQPMQPLLDRYDVWINGVRADQNANRKSLNEIEQTPQGGLRYHPMLDWTKQEIWRYINENDLPRHPLDAQGYVSIGCEPCTVKPSVGDERQGRWLGQSKTECGLHTELISK
ncbi:MAG: phosphoadenylyl-sulfate reductase [Salibacteraceae bacterium]|jgi:phosphoadenosine phosphosulfate reductase|nr:phosphoadenylyl-sulfate reductase [Salibacteraceae bacterium]MDP4763290.1 phosphoadenylyl-sulfate reductase [Salibacteraceae bacterium]MDP4934955.1 phosphoadenylyl-sulfate reductase [Salibacteraceae bacterium]